MGAEMVFGYLVIPTKREPDFDAARQRLKAMSPKVVHRKICQAEGLEDSPDELSFEDAMTMAEEAIEMIEQGWNDKRRDFVTFKVRSYILLFVGEMTWGDAPEGFTAIDRFYALGLHKAAGFVNP